MNKKYYIGADLGFKNDHSVIMCASHDNLGDTEIVEFHRYNLNNNTQKEKERLFKEEVEKLSKKYNASIPEWISKRM